MKKKIAPMVSRGVFGLRLHLSSKNFYTGLIQSGISLVYFEFSQKLSNGKTAQSWDFMYGFWACIFTYIFKDIGLIAMQLSLKDYLSIFIIADIIGCVINWFSFLIDFQRCADND